MKRSDNFTSQNVSPGIRTRTIMAIKGMQIKDNDAIVHPIPEAHGG
jgi:hypothetical protein